MAATKSVGDDIAPCEHGFSALATWAIGVSIVGLAILIRLETPPPAPASREAPALAPPAFMDSYLPEVLEHDDVAPTVIRVQPLGRSRWRAVPPLAPIPPLVRVQIKPAKAP